MLIRITIRSNIIAGAIFKILSRSFYAEILALQGFPAGLRDSYFIRDKSGYSEIQDNQTFSIAGTRKGFGDPRGTLFFELARLAEARKPPYLLFENVPGLLSHDGGRTFATILNTLDRLGYGVEWQCLNSKDFGVPQSRNRVYIVGYLDERCLTALDESKAKHPLCWNGSSSMESKCGVPTRGNRKSRHTAIS